MGGLATWSAVQQGEDLPWGQEASAGVLTWGGQGGGSETWGWGPEVGEQTQHETALPSHPPQNLDHERRCHKDRGKGEF